MRDYKYGVMPVRKSRRRGVLPVLLAIGIIAGTLGSVHSFDLSLPEFAQREALANGAVDPVVSELALPAAVLSEPVPDAQPQPPSTAQGGGEIVVALLDASGPAAADSQPSLLDAVKASPPEVVHEPVTEPSVPAEVTATEAPAPEWVEHRVTKGDSLAKIFADKGLEPALLHRIVTSSKEAGELARIKPGETLRFLFDDGNDLTRLELQRNAIDSVRVSIADDAITTEHLSKDVEVHVGSATGVIESSLFVDGQKAGLSDGQIMDLANIFGWDIDFALEIRAGDQFRVIYEEHRLEGEKLRDGPILAAEFTNRGTTYRAIRYEDTSGEIGYFDVDGQSKRRAFIRTPIRFARVSSGFTNKRWHPVLQKWRSHKGVDYAAPIGTPVKATGDGKVVFRGTKGGYGKTVILEHAGKYTTLYAHLSKYSARAKSGQRVKQGQVIGYVGMTGLATGPHLHYEFRVDGVHRDPLRVSLPKSLSLPGKELDRFRSAAQPLLAMLEDLSPGTLVASAEQADDR